MRRGGYAYSTEKSYSDWVKRFVKFHGFLDRESMLIDSELKVEQFLTDLAVKQNVAPSTQNQALNALVYCYSNILHTPFTNVKASRSRKEPRIPVVLTVEEMTQILSIMDGTSGVSL